MYDQLLPGSDQILIFTIKSPKHVFGHILALENALWIRIGQNDRAGALVQHVKYEDCSLTYKIARSQNVPNLCTLLELT